MHSLEYLEQSRFENPRVRLTAVVEEVGVRPTAVIEEVG